MRDVVVIGGGPAGLTAARALATGGWRVTVVEEHGEVGAPVHCTGVLAEDALSALGLPTSSLLNPLRSVRFVAPRGHSFAYSTATTEAVVIDRRVFDDALGAGAVAAGAELMCGRRVTALTPIAEGIRAGLSDGESLDARSVVLACGAAYGLQRSLGMGLPRAFLQSAQLELPADRPGDVEVHFGSAIAPRGFGWAVPVCRPEGQFVRVGVMAEHHADRYFARMVARIEERWQVRRPSAIQPRRRLLPLGAVARSYGPRVLAVGDAAGLVKPTTGGGIYYGVLSGQLAAEVLGAALAADDLSEARLGAYEREWRRRFQPEFSAQQALRVIAHRMRDADIDALFDLASTDGILPLVRETARFNQHRGFILALLRHPPARRVMFQCLAGAW